MINLGEKDSGVTAIPDSESKHRPNKKTKKVKRPKRKGAKGAKANKSAESTRPKFPRHALAKALRVPRAILEQNAGHACTEAEAAAFVGVGRGGPFSVEISSAIKYGLLERPETGKIQPSPLAKKILRPQSPGDDVEGYRTAIMQAPDISDVYRHYRGENLPDDQFLQNTVVELIEYQQRASASLSKYFWSRSTPPSYWQGMAKRFVS